MSETRLAVREKTHHASLITVRKVRLRTYPQHTLSLLPLLRSRPGGVHKTSVVRSPKSDKSILDCRLPIVDLTDQLKRWHGRPAREPRARCARHLDRGLAMRNQSQQTIDTEMQ